jgi:hypothetical protein
MALHLNLYHEVHKAKALKRRDPLKLSMYGLSAIIACFAGYYFIQLLRLHSLNTQLAAAKAQFEKIEPVAKDAKKREEELTAQNKAGDTLVAKIENRFYWAPMLEEVMQVVPRDVQLTRFAGEVSNDGLRRCSLTVDGLSAGADPRKVAEDLRTAIAEKFSVNYRNVSSKFKMLEDGTELVLLDGKQMPTATFAINVELSAASNQPIAQPAPRRKK